MGKTQGKAGTEASPVVVLVGCADYTVLAGNYVPLADWLKEQGYQVLTTDGADGLRTMLHAQQPVDMVVVNYLGRQHEELITICRDRQKPVGLIVISVNHRSDVAFVYLTQLGDWENFEGMLADAMARQRQAV